VLALGVIVAGAFLPARTSGTAAPHLELKWRPMPAGRAEFSGRTQPVGRFDIDVAREIAKRLGRTARFETPDFATMTGGHLARALDLAVGSVTPTKARAQVVDFAGPTISALCVRGA